MDIKKGFKKRKIDKVFQPRKVINDCDLITTPSSIVGYPSIEKKVIPTLLMPKNNNIGIIDIVDSIELEEKEKEVEKIDINSEENRLTISDVYGFVCNIKEDSRIVCEETQGNESIEVENVEAPIDKGSVGNTVTLLKNHGLINPVIGEISNNTDNVDSKGEYIPKFKLEYTDEFGRSLNPKEAYKQLSHIFHGKGSGKAKREKHLRKIAEEMNSNKLHSFEAPLKLVENGKNVDHIVLSHQENASTLVEQNKKEKKKKKTFLIPTAVKKSK